MDYTRGDPAVFCIVLNTNRRQDTLACLASLRQSTYRNLRAIVLDNRSTDGSVAAIEAAFPNVKIIPLSENHGYAGNNNVGIETAVAQGADWVFVLNEDTVMAPDCISLLVAAGESRADVGLLGPMVYHFDEPDVIQSAGGLLGPNWESIHVAQNETDRGQIGEARAVEWVSGCAIMVRADVIRQIGALDSRFFYYWEETDWCVRARQAGWQVLHVPSAKLWHKGVQRDYRPSPSITYYATRNRLLMYAKNRAPLRAWVTLAITIVSTVISWTLRPKRRSMRPHRDAICSGVADFLLHRWGQGPVRR